jgi:predicted hydrocarbon binding protein
METGLRQLAIVFNHQFGERVSLEEQATHWLWTAEDCLNCCHGNHSADCSCYLMIGILQEFLSWASGGRFYPVVELECAVSDGQRCVFRIDKKPLD